MTLSGISSMATKGVLAALADAAASAGAPTIAFESVGGVLAADRVAAGEALDVVVLASGAIDRLADDGHVDPATRTPLVLSQVAAAVPAGDDAADDPDGATPPPGPAFAHASELRAASRIGYSTGPSGTALVRMIEGWGLSDELSDRLVQARPGVPVAASLAAAEVDLGFQQLSELVGQPGVRILGVLPDDCAIETVFTSAVATASGTPRQAAELIAFLASAEASGIKAEHAFRTP